ncbi:MAG: hypothetical protein WDW38_010751 [Sanguina aurantia]
MEGTVSLNELCCPPSEQKENTPPDSFLFISSAAGLRQASVPLQQPVETIVDARAPPPAHGQLPSGGRLLSHGCLTTGHVSRPVLLYQLSHQPPQPRPLPHSLSLITAHRMAKDDVVLPPVLLQQLAKPSPRLPSSAGRCPLMRPLRQTLGV